MTKALFPKLLLIGLAFGISVQNDFSCSAYKLTSNGATMFAINYDAWFVHPRIWFETNDYGAAFTGANNQGGSQFTPQSGMNVHGLSFGTLATATPENGSPDSTKKQIANRANYLKDILHRCKTVAEVKSYIEQYDHSTLSNDVFFYTDKEGNYLIVEPYKLLPGKEDKYVLANFCPSTITDFNTVKQQRYINGTAFLKNKIEASVDFCTALSDTMHVCRPGIGDVTLLTSIWDLQGGKINLYFYHDYKNPVQFDLEAELLKGDHTLEIPDLFPPNEEYQKLVDYKTPLNSSPVEGFLRGCLLLFFISALYFPVSYLRNRKAPYAPYKLLLTALSLALGYFMYVLETEIGIFYFPAPYKTPASFLINTAAYLPFVLLLLLVPLLRLNRNLFREGAWHPVSRGLLLLNNVAYSGLIGMFCYWGFYTVF